jgi:membrane protein DedA with SNARE-associated domain
MTMTQGFTDTLLALVPVYGPLLLGLIAMLACIGLPLPATLSLMAGGAFAEAGDLDPAPVLTAILIGAVIGDQIGFALGQRAQRLVARLSRKPSRARLLAEATARLQARDLAAVFLSRWLFSPLSPWVNLMAGSLGVVWARFTLAAFFGRILWIGIYFGLGWAFVDQIDRLGDVLGDATGLLAMAAVAFVAWRLIRAKVR